MATEDQKKVERERLRMVTVRHVLKAAMEKKSSGEDSYVPFYIALSEYLTTSLDRLVQQDWRFIAKIRKRVGEKEQGVSDEVETVLDEVREILCGALVVASQAKAATSFLKSHGSSVLENFESIIDELDRYMSGMGHHAASTNIAAKYFNVDDWRDMARFDDEVIERENRQYEAVFEALPATAVELTREGIEKEVYEILKGSLSI